VPHILDALGFIPCLGGLLGLIAWGWGVVIYVKGTASAHDMSTGKATLAVLMPFIVLFLLTLLFVLIAVVLSVVARGGR